MRTQDIAASDDEEDLYEEQKFVNNPEMKQ